MGQLVMTKGVEAVGNSWVLALTLTATLLASGAVVLTVLAIVILTSVSLVMGVLSTLCALSAMAAALFFPAIVCTCAVIVALCGTTFLALLGWQVLRGGPPPDVSEESSGYSSTKPSAVFWNGLEKVRTPTLRSAPGLAFVSQRWRTQSEDITPPVPAPYSSPALTLRKGSAGSGPVTGEQLHRHLEMTLGGSAGAAAGSSMGGVSSPVSAALCATAEEEPFNGEG